MNDGIITESEARQRESASLQALQSPSAQPATLYAMCEELQAWTDTLELCRAQLEAAEDEEIRLQLREDIRDIEIEIGKWLKHGGDKVDRFNAYVSHLESQAGFCRSEEKRIAAFRHSLENTVEQLEQYAIAALEFASVKRITGRVSFLALQRCPDSVKELDAQKVPESYFRRVLAIDGEGWERWWAYLESVLDMQQFDEADKLFYEVFKVKEMELEKARVKRAIKAGDDVPGCTLSMGKHSLKRG